MRRLTAFLLAMLLVFGIIPITSAFAGEYSTEKEITFKINTEYQTDMDLKLWVIKRADYQILAPARQLAEKLEAEVSWDDAKQQVTFTKGKYSASMVIGEMTGVSNGVTKELQAAADMIDDKAYVPVEFIGDALNYRVVREQYGRFIRLVQRTIAETPNKYQETKPGMAELQSTYHRPVPTEFEKSSDPNDLLFYTDYKWTPEEELIKTVELDTSNLPSGEVIYDMDDIFESTPEGSHIYGWWKQVEIEDETVPFDKVLRIACTKAPANTVNYIVKPQKRVQEFIDPDEKFLVSFYVRLVEGGHVDTGLGRLFTHVEESYIPKYYKSVAEETDFSDQWKKVYCLATGVENANHIGFTTGFWTQVVDIGGFQVEKLADDADVSMFEALKQDVDLLSIYLAKDAPWRQEALDRIEEVRKGDFKVKVQDKDGNPVEGAEVEFDMFEHEFRFGAVLDTSFYESSIGWTKRYAETLGVNFNSAGAGNACKESLFMSNPTQAQRKFDDAKNLGIRNFRGHVLWMPTLQTNGMDRPFRFYGPGQKDNLDWTTFEKYVKSQFNEFMATMDEISILEVANEMSTRVTWDGDFSEYGYPNKTYLYELFKWADEIRRENNYDITLAYCGNNAGSETYWTMLDGFVKENLPIDMFILQGHSYDRANDLANNVLRIGYYNEVFDRYTYEYGKQFGISEYSIYADTEEYQADHTRDMLILAFSHPGAEEFNIFWYADVYSGGTSKAPAGCAPLYGHEFEEKLGLKAWQDMIYNKWWTKDAKTTTDSNGKGQVRGFYGDYDVTVRVNGQVVATEMAAYHKGYENELTITLQ